MASRGWADPPLRTDPPGGRHSEGRPTYSRTLHTVDFLPPANEVWGKVIFSQACVKNSVHRGGAWSRGVCSGGWVPGPRGSAQGGLPGGDPPRTASAVGSTHPTGMHSCYQLQRSWAKAIFSQASVHRDGLPQCMLGYAPPGPDLYWDQTPQTRHPPDQTPWTRHPQEQTPPTPRPDTLWEQTLPGPDPPRADPTPPGSRLQHTVNGRPVRILLECILIAIVFCSTELNRAPNCSGCSSVEKSVKK